MQCLAYLTESFGQPANRSLVEELLEVAGEVERGLPSYYWSGLYLLQQRRLARAAGWLRKEWAAERETGLKQLRSVRRHLNAAHRALGAADWPGMRHHLGRFRTQILGLSQLADCLEEAESKIDLEA